MEIDDFYAELLREFHVDDGSGPWLRDSICALSAAADAWASDLGAVPEAPLLDGTAKPRNPRQNNLMVWGEELRTALWHHLAAI